MIEIDDNGLFKQRITAYSRLYTTETWNEANFKKKPAPDCVKNECGSY